MKVLLFILLLPLLSISQDIGGTNNDNGQSIPKINTKELYIVRSNGDTAMIIKDSAWIDITAPATTIRQGATTKPDFNIDSITLDFPYNDSTEVAYISYHFNHNWVIGSDVSPHIHYLQNETDIPTFVIVYRWIGNGYNTTSFDTIVSENVVFSYTSGSIEQIIEFPNITPPSIITGVSSQLQCKVFRREEVTITSDIQVVEVDIHILTDGLGSDSKYVRSWD